jgi:aldehyde:ferredoxin oxidoreductase
MKGGYMGKILFVDLSKGEVWDESLEEVLCRDFIGGYGLGAKVILDRQQPGVDALGPEALMGFVTGPLTGTPAPIGSRYTVVGKSPLTGTWGDANSGGDFGPHLKFAGYDAVFFRGVADRPVYLDINEGKAALRDAEHLWGKDSHETEEMLKAELGKDTRVACIGPAGEKLSLISCVMNNKGRAAGRSGLGAVMGAKKLKAIAVNGRLAVPVAHKSELAETRKRYLEQMREAVVYMMFQDGGTASAVSYMHMVGEMPLKNWGGMATVDLTDIDPLDGPNINTLQEKKYGCWSCPIRCGGLMKGGTEYKYAEGVHRPEYETLASFGTMCLNNHPESVIIANDICNRYGLDTISAGTAIAFAIECYENGLITSKDTEGVELTWGNHRAIIAMTEQMAKREGLGDILADGVRAAAAKIGGGAEEFAMHVGGQEPGLHDPRSALTYATTLLDATPGRHTQGNANLVAQGLPMPQFDPETPAGMGEANKIACNMNHIMQSGGTCMFGYLCMDVNHIPEFLNLVTGSSYSIDDVLKIGERIANIRQAFNILEGISAGDIRIPNRILGRPPLTDGPTAGKEVDVETMQREFFAAMDWDPETGKPSKAKLTELGLKDLADALWT